METERVNTSQLREGDLVLEHGLVIQLGRREECPKSWGEVYRFPGTVLNMGEVYHRGHITRGLLRQDAQWPVQGNTLALWDRIVSGVAGSVNCDQLGEG